MAVRVFQLSIVFTIVLYASGTFPLGPLKNEIHEEDFSLYLKDPKDVIVTKGHSTTFRCDVGPFSGKVRHLWLFNSKPIDTTIIKSQVLEDGSLYLPKIGGKFASNYEGIYQCNVTDSKGLTLLSLPAKLQLASIGREFDDQFLNATVKEHQPVILPCSIDSIPRGTVIWEKDSLPLPHNTRYVPHPSGALLITKTVMSDTGIYRCKVINDVLKKTKASKGGLLSIKQMLNEEQSSFNLKNNKPNIISPTASSSSLHSHSQNVTALIGDNITLSCLANGWPSPRIQWFLNGTDLKHSEVFLTLKIKALNYSGNYECLAGNSAGQDRFLYNLTVLQAPYFNITPTSMSYPVARLVRLKCQALGHPKPSITWLKNGAPLDIDPRVDVTDFELKLSQSYTKDAGLYQCIARNSVGAVWTSAQLRFTKSENLPLPPQNVSCEPHDETSICLRWNPSQNVTVSAYSVHTYAAAGDLKVTNLTYFLMERLNVSTNYTFFVRVYTTAASDHSQYVYCATGPVGNRNLRVQKISENVVEVTWSKLTNDFPCTLNPTTVYKLEWRRVNQQSINSNFVHGFRDVLKGFKSSLTYEFRINESEWVSYTIPVDDEDFFQTTELNNTLYNNSNLTPTPPYQLDTASITSRSVNLIWNDSNHFDKFYSICFYEVEEKKNNRDCLEDELLVTSLNNYEINKLKPNVVYEFKVKTHNKFSGEIGPWSPTLKVHTNIDVPSSVREVKYNVLNRTTVCIKWKPPLSENGKLLYYLVTYTPDINWPLDKWHTVHVSTSKKKLLSYKSCRNEQDFVSMLLSNLKPDEKYRIVIRAATQVGLGNPAQPITLTTKNAQKVQSPSSSPSDNEESLIEDEEDFDDDDEDETTNMKSKDEVDHKQKLGIALGIALSLFCIVSFAVCLLVHRRRLKRQAIPRVRYSTTTTTTTGTGRGGGSNYYSGNSRTPNSSSVQIQSGCIGEAHEMEHLVDNDNKELTPALTKNANLTTTQPVNGISRHRTANGLVHITENPQFFNHEQNGSVELSKQGLPLPLVEDSNSNLKNTHLDDLKKLYEASRNKLKSSPKTKTISSSSGAASGLGTGTGTGTGTVTPPLPPQASAAGPTTTTAKLKKNYNNKDLDSSLDTSLNSTQMSELDLSDLMSSPPPPQYLISSPLGPNG